MTGKITIQAADGTWVVRAGGAVLGESDDALALTDGSDTEVIFFPRDDIAMEFLDSTEDMEDHPEFGQARLFSIVTKSRVLEGAAWSYENPSDGAAALKNRMAFKVGDTVAVEQV